MTEQAASPEHETRAIAIIGMTLAMGVIAALKNREIMTKELSEEIFENALTGFERHFAVGDLSIQVARVMLEKYALVFFPPPTGQGQ